MHQRRAGAELATLQPPRPNLYYHQRRDDHNRRSAHNTKLEAKENAIQAYEDAIAASETAYLKTINELEQEKTRAIIEEQARSSLVAQQELAELEDGYD